MPGMSPMNVKRVTCILGRDVVIRINWMATAARASINKSTKVIGCNLIMGSETEQGKDHA